MASIDNHNGNPSQPGLVYRPQFQLRSLPIRHRWEVTRRHPYYQQWWKSAQSFYNNSPAQHEAEFFLRQGAVVILGAIGVSGSPPDPVTEFEQLEADMLGQAWLSGAVHPITFGGLAGLMIGVLPEETLGQLGLMFCEAACGGDEDGAPGRVQAMLKLSMSELAGLDTYPDQPIVSMNPAASGRQMEEALTALLRQWKAERNLTQRRDRSDKFDTYLEVWDLREGWCNGTYDRSRERTLKEVANELNESISTVHNHYRRAFELIIGHAYSPPLWCRIFGVLKLSALCGEELGPAKASNRPLASPTRRDVPDSVVTSEGNRSSGSVVEQGSMELGDQATWQLVSDIIRLIDDDRDDEQILEELDLSPQAEDVVAYLRRHGEDFI